MFDLLIKLREGLRGIFLFKILNENEILGHVTTEYTDFSLIRLLESTQPS